MPQVFISYKRTNDKNEGDEIYRDEVIKVLENLPYEYWYDKEQIQGGELWRQSIEDALENSFVCLVVVTDKILASGWSFFEVSFARGFGITVIPWYVNGNPPPSNTAFGTLLNERNAIKYLSEELPNALFYAYRNPIADYMNNVLLRATIRPRILFHIAHTYLIGENIVSSLTWFRKTLQELSSIDAKWQNILLTYSNLFNRTQKKIYNKLVQHFDKLKEITDDIEIFLRNLLEQENSIDVKDEGVSERFSLNFINFLDAYVNKSLGENKDYGLCFLYILKYINTKHDYNYGIKDENKFIIQFLTEDELTLVPSLRYFDWIPF